MILDHAGQMQAMRTNGWSLRQIGEFFGTSHQRVHQILGNTGRVSRYPQLSDVDWLETCVGQGRTQAMIAREVGCCRHTVGEAMKRLGIVPMGKRPLEQRFWKRVEILGRDDCWRWLGAAMPLGYGQFWIGTRSVGSHRYSWEIANGSIPAGMWVLHRCDNPTCVNPRHLFLGTPSDNTRDSIQKGRWQLPNCRLSQEDVTDIRQRYSGGAVLQRELAAEYGVGIKHISNIIRGRKWKL